MNRNLFNNKWKLTILTLSLLGLGACSASVSSDGDPMRAGRADAYENDSDECSDKFLKDHQKVTDKMNTAHTQEEFVDLKKTIIKFSKKYEGVYCKVVSKDPQNQAGYYIDTDLEMAQLLSNINDILKSLEPNNPPPSATPKPTKPTQPQYPPVKQGYRYSGSKYCSSSLVEDFYELYPRFLRTDGSTPDSEHKEIRRLAVELQMFYPQVECQIGDYNTGIIEVDEIAEEIIKDVNNRLEDGFVYKPRTNN